MVRRLGRRMPALLVMLALVVPAAAADRPRPVRADAVISVPDMTCDLCAWSIRTKLLELPAVARVRVDVEELRVVVEIAAGKDVTDAALRGAVEAAGFEAGVVERYPRRS